MKKLALLLSAALVSAFFLPGCATTAGGLAIAGGEQAAGDIYANTKLGQIDPSAAGTALQRQAVADLQRVGNDLVSFTAGTLSFTELGAVQAQLEADKVALSSNSQAVTQINSVLNIFVHQVAGPNGLVLPAQALAQGAVANIVQGFNISIQTFEGRWTVTNPAGWPSVPAAVPSGQIPSPAKTP